MEKFLAILGFCQRIPGWVAWFFLEPGAVAWSLRLGDGATAQQAALPGVCRVGNMPFGISLTHVQKETRKSGSVMEFVHPSLIYRSVTLQRPAVIFCRQRRKFSQADIGFQGIHEELHGVVSAHLESA